MGPSHPAWAAAAVGASVAVYDRPGGHRTDTLTSPGLLGAPLTFLAVRQTGSWLQVRLPVRPNGSVGWVRLADVALYGLDYRLDLHRAAHRLVLTDRGRVVRTFVVAVGQADTPTPGGTYYLDALVRVDPPNGAYGPWAFGLNAFPPGLSTFNGRPAVIGLHGTDRPDLLGQDVSHGCIRMADADISYLAARLPLGTPVRILS